MRGKLREDAADFSTKAKRVLYVFKRTAGLAKQRLTLGIKENAFFPIITVKEAFALLA
jgi:hypothetical protein